MGHVLKVWNEHIYTWKHNFVDSCGDNAGPVLTDKDLSILKHKCLENVNILARVDGSAADGLVSWYLSREKDASQPDSEEYKKYRRLYIYFLGETIRR